MFETVNMQQWVLATGFMVLLIVGFMLVLRRFSPSHPALKGLTQKRCSIIENTYLSPKHRLCIVNIDNTEYALVLHPTGATHIGPLASTSDKQQE